MHPNPTKRPLTTLLTALLLSTGCATSEPPTSAEDAGSEERDLGTPEPDLGTPEPDLGQPPMDMGRPIICEPGFADCTDDGEVVACNEFGTEYITTPCSGNKECRGGECLDPIICQEGETACVSATEYQECRPGGTAFRVVECDPGQACVNGACVTGSVNGTACASDDECAGGMCHCGSGTDDACDARWTPAYCSTGCTGAADCASDELCVSADVLQLESAAANVNHCVKKCQGVCPIDGLSCRSLPAIDENGDVSFQEGCYFDSGVDIGDECQNDVDCVGGVCLKGYFNTGYCTTRCEQTGCPDDAACVQLGGADYYCTLKCGDGSPVSTDRCPLEPTPEDDRFDVNCELTSTFDGPVSRVCVNPSRP